MTSTQKTNTPNQAMDAWEQFLNPESLRKGLIGASIFLSALEMLKSAVIDRVRDFFWCGFDENGDKISPDYQSKVLTRDKSKFKASLLWFRDMGAIDDADLERVDRIRRLRNDLAHHLPEFITASRTFDETLLVHLCEFVCKVERWWLRNVELPMNPDFDNQDISAIPDSEMSSGRMVLLHMMLEIACSDDDKARRYYDCFQQARRELETKQRRPSYVVRGQPHEAATVK